jgi:hypothetical protein
MALRDGWMDGSEMENLLHLCVEGMYIAGAVWSDLAWL